MNCNCIKTLEEKSLKTIQKKHEGKAVIERAGGILGKVLMLGDMSNATTQEFEYSYSRIKKDGSQQRAVNKTITLIHSYCPFCGTKISKDEEEAAGKEG